MAASSTTESIKLEWFATITMPVPLGKLRNPVTIGRHPQSVTMTRAQC